MRFGRRQTVFLILGDIIVLLISLATALFLRSGGELQGIELWEHVKLFLPLMVLWLLVFLIAGLYEKHIELRKSRLPTLIVKSQIANALLAALYFYFIPMFGIAPKTILVLFCIISSALLIFFRGMVFYQQARKAEQIPTLLIGSGAVFDELKKELAHRRYGIKVTHTLSYEDIADIGKTAAFLESAKAEGVSLVIADLDNDKVEPILGDLYKTLLAGIQSIDASKLYEDIFNRVPLALLRYSWFLKHVSERPRHGYESVKRCMDIVITAPLLLVPAITYVLAGLAMKIEDGGPVCIQQQRIGRNNKIIKLLKFRTMSFNDDGDWKEKGKVNKVTKVGAFLRVTRLDEFPQLWNVLKGDISLIGPRPEFPPAVAHYDETIPYYNVRHLIQPGLSGWAQLYGEHPHHGTDVHKTANKLSYDLYYVKNSSFFLDLKIALRTIQILLSRSGI